MVQVLARLSRVCQVSGGRGLTCGADPRAACAAPCTCNPGAQQVPLGAAAASTASNVISNLPLQACTAAHASVLRPCAANPTHRWGMPPNMQVNVAPAAAQLAAGSLSVDAWRQQFSLDAIRNLAMSA